MDSENNCRLVSSRGILKSCDIHSATPVSSIKELDNYNWDGLRPGSTVYVCSSALGRLARLLGQLPHPIILVSGDADEDVPYQISSSKDDFETFIESPKIIHWFAQNGVTRHPKFSQIPIGLDYHTMSEAVNIFGPQHSPLEQEHALQQILQGAPTLINRSYKSYSNFHSLPTVVSREENRIAYPHLSFNSSVLSGNDRSLAIERIPASLVEYELRRVDRITTWENQAKYAFVISPHGYGLDCHRTWEALCLGCIPIVRTSPIDGLFEGLPVYIVQDWADVTEANLKKVLTDFSQRTFDLNRLTLSYWMNQINAKKLLVS
jgi:hypothetical protein